MVQLLKCQILIEKHWNIQQYVGVFPEVGQTYTRKQFAVNY